MLSVKQIQKLEEKVFKAIEIIKALKQENIILKSELASANKKIEELEQIISDYRSSQAEIEEGIVNAIKQLDDLDKISTENIPASAGNKANEKANKAKEAEKPVFFQNNSSTLSDEEEQIDEVEEIKINYSKISQNKPGSNIPDKKQSQSSVQNESDKSNNAQLDIF